MYKKFLSLILCVASLLVASSAFAISLDEAKSKGLVGEARNGYLAAVGSATSDVQQLINQINAQRRDKYQEIAKKNGTQLSAVETLAANKAIDATIPGNYIQLPNGAWAKK